MKILLSLAVVCGLAIPSLAADKPKASPEDAFKKLDKNSDNKLDLAEFKGKRDGDKAAAAEKIFKTKDKDNDGFLSLEEFKAGGKKKKDK